MKYSGGCGLGADYCRSAQVSVSVEVTPSLLVTRWDVLPAELPHQCYVVLDLLNSAPHEMDLHYTPTKHILIEAGDSCRVPVPVDRCPLVTLSQVYRKIYSNYKHCKNVSTVDNIFVVIYAL